MHRIGTRHIKIWRVEENRSVSPSKRRFALDGTPQPTAVQPTLKTLAGRNVLLGPLVEATFTAIAPISNHKAIVCAEKGDVCLLDDSEGQKLIKLASTGFFIMCLAVDVQSRMVRIGGRNGRMKSMALDELLDPSPPESLKAFLECASGASGPDFCAMGYAANSLVTVDSKNSIEISNPDSNTADLRMQKVLSAHGDSVLGIGLLSPENKMNAAFLTWSANGTIVFWDLDGSSKGLVKVEVEQLSAGDDDPVNQCQIVRAGKNAAYLVTGDKYGVLRVLRIVDPSTQTCELETRAHMSDIQDIALHESENTTMIASCSRDRTVQMFRLLLGEWVLIQTLDDHSASVCSLFFAENGEKLISCSTDRTIHIRQLVKKDVGGQDIIGAVPLRIITLKASPVSMAACFADQMGNFVVSLLDRSVAIYEIASGRLVSSFRATDSEGAEAVVLDALVMGRPSCIPGRPTILAGVSTTDKSVRVYDGVTGAFLDREFGHTASVTDVALLESDSEEKILISSGAE
jgi:WD40 repeat protein